MLGGLCHLRTGRGDGEEVEACRVNFWGGSGAPSKHKRESINTIQDGRHV